MINARSTDKLLTTIQSWAKKFVPGASDRARDTALLALLDELKGLGEGNSSYEDTITNLHKLLELRMNPPVLSVDDFPGRKAPDVIKLPDVIATAKKKREQCLSVKTYYDGDDGTEVNMRCGRDAGHDGKHNASVAWDWATVPGDKGPVETAKESFQLPDGSTVEIELD